MSHNARQRTSLWLRNADKSLHPILRQPIKPTLTVSLGGAACETFTDEIDLAIDGTAIPAASAAEDLIKVLLLIIMIFYGIYKLFEHQR
jgi:hypothetical protein